MVQRRTGSGGQMQLLLCLTNSCSRAVDTYYRLETLKGSESLAFQKYTPIRVEVRILLAAATRVIACLRFISSGNSLGGAERPG